MHVHVTPYFVHTNLHINLHTNLHINLHINLHTNLHINLAEKDGSVAVRRAIWSKYRLYRQIHRSWQK